MTARMERSSSWKEKKGHLGTRRNIGYDAKEEIQILPTGRDTPPSLVAMEVPGVRGQEDGWNDSSAGMAVTKRTGLPTNDRKAAFNCRVLFIIQPTMGIKLQKIKENKGSKAMTIEE